MNDTIFLITEDNRIEEIDKYDFADEYSNRILTPIGVEKELFLDDNAIKCRHRNGEITTIYDYHNHKLAKERLYEMQMQEYEDNCGSQELPTIFYTEKEALNFLKDLQDDENED